MNKLKDQKPKVNVNQSIKPNIIDLPKTNTSTRFSGGAGNVTNISKNKGVQLPDFVRNNPNPIKSIIDEVIKRIVKKEIFLLSFSIYRILEILLTYKLKTFSNFLNP